MGKNTRINTLKYFKFQLYDTEKEALTRLKMRPSQNLHFSELRLDQNNMVVATVRLKAHIMLLSHSLFFLSLFLSLSPVIVTSVPKQL